MQRFLVVRRSPSALERLLGRRRARRLRRRVGIAALGTGVFLLRPRRSIRPLMATCVVVAALVVTVTVTR
jgi:hypothetical protein